MNKVPMVISLSIRKSTELLAFIYGFDQMDIGQGIFANAKNVCKFHSG